MLSRITKCTANSTWDCRTVSPAAKAKTISAAVAPISLNGWCTVVSCGPDQRAYEMSSKPTTLRSCGIRRPDCRAASKTPKACRSLPQSTAVGGSGSRNSSGVAPMCTVTIPVGAPGEQILSPVPTGLRLHQHVGEPHRNTAFDRHPHHLHRRGREQPVESHLKKRRPGDLLRAAVTLLPKQPLHPAPRSPTPPRTAR